MKHKFIIFLFAYLFSLVYAQSVIDPDYDLFSPEYDVLDSEYSVTSSEASVMQDEYNVLNEENSVIDPSFNVVDSNLHSIGVYDIVVSKTQRDVYDSVVDSLIQETIKSSYANGYEKWLEITSSASPEVRQSFVRYFSDWQWQGQKESFFTYAKSRAEREQQIDRIYKAAVTKFGVGSALVATTWIVSYVTPAGQILSLSLLIIAKQTTMQAISGAVIGGLTQASLAYIEGKRGEELLYATINGSADGFLIGAITGLATGVFQSVKIFSGATVVEDEILTKTGLVLDKKGKVIGKAIRFSGIADDGIYYVGKNCSSVFNKYGREVAKVVESNGKSILKKQNGDILGYLIDGKIFSNSGLKANAIHSSCGYTYKTDVLARLKNYSGQLRLEEGLRNTKAQGLAGGIDRLADDHGGHLIARIFGGSSDLDNMVAMSGSVNTGTYKKYENLWAEALKKGKEVFVEGQCVYEGNSLRPVEFIIKYTIDGVKNKATIFNH